MLNRYKKYSYIAVLILFVIVATAVISIKTKRGSLNSDPQQIAPNVYLPINYSVPKPTHRALTPTIPVPSEEYISPKDFIPLSSIWSTGEKTFEDRQIPLSFNYPSYFKTINYRIVSTDHNTFMSLKFYTPYVDTRIINNPDWNYYSQNTMGIYFTVFLNSKKLSLKDYIYSIYDMSSPAAKDFQIKERLDSGLTFINYPQPNSYLFVGTLGENPAKRIYFIYKSFIYEIDLFGGTQTGEGYSPDAENVFDKVINSITFK